MASVELISVLGNFKCKPFEINSDTILLEKKDESVPETAVSE